MNKILITCLLSFCCVFQPAMAQTDKKAQTILEGVSKKLSSLKSIKGNFSIHLDANNGKVNETKKGSFSMKGNKYHVILDKQEIICDGKTVWTYSKETKETQVSNYNPDEQTISPTKLLTNFWDKEYKYRYVTDKKIGTKNCSVLELTPINAKKQFSKVELHVDKATNLIASGSIWEKKGNKYDYEISNVTSNPTLQDSYFQYDAKTHPGVEVVDLR